MLHKITSKNFIFDYDRYNMIYKLKTDMHTHTHTETVFEDITKTFR